MDNFRWHKKNEFFKITSTFWSSSTQPRFGFWHIWQTGFGCSLRSASSSFDWSLLVLCGFFYYFCFICHFFLVPIIVWKKSSVVVVFDEAKQAKKASRRTSTYVVNLVMSSSWNLPSRAWALKFSSCRYIVFLPKTFLFLILHPKNQSFQGKNTFL